MPFTIAEESPESADAMRLLAELDAELHLHPYPPESRHAFSVDKLLRERVAFFVTRYDGEPAGCGGLKSNVRDFRRAPFGEYREDPLSVYFEKSL